MTQICFLGCNGFRAGPQGLGIFGDSITGSNFIGMKTALSDGATFAAGFRERLRDGNCLGLFHGTRDRETRRCRRQFLGNRGLLPLLQTSTPAVLLLFFG